MARTSPWRSSIPRARDWGSSEYEVSYSSNNGSYVGYSGSYAEFAPQNGVRTATVINQQKSTQIAVHKTWHGGSAPSNATATFRLYAYVQGASPETAEWVQNVDDVVLPVDAGGAGASGDAATGSGAVVQDETGVGGEIVNKKQELSGVIIPGTGGPGTTMLYVLGSALILATTTVLLRKHLAR